MTPVPVRPITFLREVLLSGGTVDTLLYVGWRMTLKQIALALAWVVMVVAIIWRIRSAVRGLSGRDKTMYISFYIVFLVLPMAVILLRLGFTPVGLYVGIPSFFILLFLCQQAFRFWMRLWRRDSH